MKRESSSSNCIHNGKGVSILEQLNPVVADMIALHADSHLYSLPFNLDLLTFAVYPKTPVCLENGK